MGLSTTYDCFEGSYSYFNEWRNAIASALGYKLESYDYLGKKMFYIAVNKGLRTKKHLGGVWENPPKDVIQILFVHSDCDGIIQSKYCSSLADRLKEILAILLEEKTPYYNNHATTQLFIEGLRKAAKDGADIEFC
jgi:hypothetical protein